jgi:hypothetical protein
LITPMICISYHNPNIAPAPIPADKPRICRTFNWATVKIDAVCKIHLLSNRLNAIFKLRSQNQNAPWQAHPACL